MRKLKTVLLMLTLSVGSLVSAATEPVENLKSPTALEIGKLLKNPAFSVEGETKAYVTFTVNREQEIVVLSVEAEMKEVEWFIKSRLNYKKIETTLEKGREYKIPIKITSES